MKSKNPKYRIEEGICTDLDGDAYTIYNVYHNEKYIFSADTEWQVQAGISKREYDLAQKSKEVAAAAFLAAHDGSNYLREPFVCSGSGMGIKKV